MEQTTYTYSYPRPALTADMIVIKLGINEDYKVLLIKRKHSPFKDFWALPGGFMEETETLKECAIRELREETGIDVDYCILVDILDGILRDPRGRVISAVYKCYVPQNTKVVASDDAVDYGWFSADEVEQLEIAFDHKDIILKTLNNLSYDKIVRCE